MILFVHIFCVNYTSGLETSSYNLHVPLLMIIYIQLSWYILSLSLGEGHVSCKKLFPTLLCNLHNEEEHEFLIADFKVFSK